MIIGRVVDENYGSVLLFLLFWNVVKYYLYFSLREAHDQKEYSDFDIQDVFNIECERLDFSKVHIGINVIVRVHN